MAFQSPLVRSVSRATALKGEFVLKCSFQALFNLQQDTELAFSSNSALRAGLPFVFLTHDLNYVPSSILRQRAPPPHLELIKYYFRPQFEELELRFHNVEALGAATLREWKKGLETSGREMHADTARFEQWELHKGSSKARILPAQNNTSMLGTSEPLATEGPPLPKFDRMQQGPSRSAAGTPSSGYIPLDLSNAGSMSGGKHHCFMVSRAQWLLSRRRPFNIRTDQLYIQNPTTQLANRPTVYGPPSLRRPKPYPTRMR